MFKSVFEIKTYERLEIRDISKEINCITGKSGVKNGLVNIFSTHSTSGIVVNENEPGLLEDFKDLLQTVIPSENNYKHDRIDNNADSHLRALFIGNNVTVPLENGKIELGTWQSIFFVELDGPRIRNISISVI